MISEESVIEGADRLIEHARKHKHSRASSIIRRVVLGLYNSHAWPMDLRSMQHLDDENRRDVLRLIDLQCRPFQTEIQDRISGGESTIEEFSEIERSE